MKCEGGGLYVSYLQNILEWAPTKDGFTMIWFAYFFPFCGVVNVEVGGYMSHIHLKKISLRSHKKIRSLLLKMASQWSDLPFFPFYGVVNVEVGAICLIFTMDILILAHTKKIRSLFLKMALQ